MSGAFNSPNSRYGSHGNGTSTDAGMILIIDDDPELCSSLERLFRYAGYDVVAVQKPLEVLSLLGVRKPKAIVLDLNLPMMDGLTLLKAIRSDPNYASVPVLVYTADFSESNELLARQLGAQDYIVKGTVGWDALLQRIDRAISPEPRQFRLSGA